MTDIEVPRSIRRISRDMAATGVDWWLARLATGVRLPNGGTTTPLLPVYEWDSIDFRDTLKLHQIMDMEEAVNMQHIKTMQRN